jgi:hypothetical protein
MRACVPFVTVVVFGAVLLEQHVERDLRQLVRLACARQRLEHAVERPAAQALDVLSSVDRHLEVGFDVVAIVSETYT